MNIVRLISIVAVLAALLGSILDMCNYRFGNFISICGMTTMFIVLARWLEMTLKDVRKLRNVVDGDLLKYAKSTFRQVKYPHKAELRNRPEKTSLGVTGISGNEGKSSVSSARLKGGRYSTPEVRNEKAKETLAGLMFKDNPDRIAGIYDESAVNINGVSHVNIRPGMAIQQLIRTSANYLVIDEREIHRGQWHGAFSASGTVLMKELLETVQFAINSGITTYLIRSAGNPDVNSNILRSTKATQLPLTEEQLNESAGANLSAVLQTLQSFAKERQTNP